MSIGDNPADSAARKEAFDRAKAQRDVHEAARLAGYKPLFRRLLDRLRPHREGPGSDPAEFPRHHRRSWPLTSKQPRSRLATLTSCAAR
jgi:hypothetical protein